MRFMRTEEDTDVNPQEGKLTAMEAKAWAEEYFNTDTKQSEEALAEKWAEEHKKKLVNGIGIIFISFLL